MQANDLKPYITKFITVTLDDSSTVSGYISNPGELNNDSLNQLTLVNGLQNAIVQINRIIKIEIVSREDTTQIPIIGESSDLISRLNKKKVSDFDEKLDELLDKSISGSLEVTLPNGKVIQSRKNDDE